MNFGFTEEQELLRGEARKFLDSSCPMEEVRRVMETPEGFSRDLWKQIAELGWVGLTIPEEFGGAGLGWVDLVVLLEEIGRGLFPSPLISTVLAASAILEGGSRDQKERWLPGIADGTRIGTLAILEESDSLDPGAVRLAAERDGEAWVLGGTKHFVHDASVADLFVVAFLAAGSPTLAVVERTDAGVATTDFPLIDRTRRMGNLALDGVRIAPDRLLRGSESGDAAARLERLLDRGAIAVTAEMIGTGEGALDITVEFAKQRIQFDSPIGRFQSVKHPLAEMHVDVESFKSLCYYAAWALDGSPDEVPRAASMAKAYATEALARIGIDGVQLHGAVGYTEEYDIQLYLKRSKWARPAYGDAEYHYDRIARLSAESA
jgi:alkylation response protein AidB-like acyl-CoA dehydrogenase